MTDTLHLTIDGMTCQACASRIEKVLNKKPAIAQADVNFANETAQIQFDGEQTTPEQIIDWVNKSGFSATVQQPDTLFDTPPTAEKLPLSLIATGVCLLPFLLGMAGMMVGNHQLMPPLWLQFGLATLVQFGLALPFYQSAWASIKGRLANMDVLVVLGTLTIWAYSTYVWLFVPSNGHLPNVYFEAGVMVIAFVKLGKFLEHRTKKHSLNSLNLLLNLTPDWVDVKVNNSWQKMSLATVQQGQILLAKAGSRIATDGVVVAGEGWCDESHLTGESVPLAKRLGDTVMAGAMVQNGSLEYRVTATGRHTRLGDMIQALSDAQGSKAHIARLADRVAGVFVLVVVALSLVTFVANFYWLGVFDTALMRAVAVLVIACPCALGLATPTAIMAGMGVAVRHGVWFKDAQALELAGSIDSVAFDKTGTLTQGKPTIVAHFIVDKSLKYGDILALVANVERHANHPLATTLVKFAENYFHENKQLLPNFSVSQVRTVAGQGIQANVAEFGVVKVGKFAFTHVTLPNDSDPVWQIASQVAISVNDIPLAGFALADELHSDSQTVIEALKMLNLNPIILSGDKQSVVDTIAHQLGISQAVGELSPRDKARYINDLQMSGKKLAMVGDGVNDAPAMATAIASFAVENATDIAKHSATARLMGDSLKHMVFAVKIARATLRNIKQNLFFAFIYNVLGIPLAGFGLLNPMLAAAAMALSSISVLLNALRLTRLKLG